LCPSYFLPPPGEGCPKDRKGASSITFDFCKSLEGYGFLKTISGREIYFNWESVPGDGFDRMKIGTGVWFVEKESEKGPWASLVQIIDPAS
jgi:cold shock CspA family protein